MSRSYKKHPACPEKSIRHVGSYKRFANKAVRTYKDEIPNGKWYRKIWNPYDICEGVHLTTLKEWIALYHREDSYTRDYRHKEYPTEQAWIKEYHKYYTRK